MLMLFHAKSSLIETRLYTEVLLTPSRTLKLQNHSVGSLRLLFQHLYVYYVYLESRHAHRMARNLLAKRHVTLPTTHSIRTLTYYAISTSSAGVARKLKIIFHLGE
jgi:hypothetical protein